MQRSELKITDQTDTELKVYVEDYVVSFLEKEMLQKDKVIVVLFGDGYEKEGIRYFWMKGAGFLKSEKDKFGRKQKKYFSQIQKEFFPDMKGIGWTFLKKEEGSVLNILKSMKEQNFNELKTYYIYYENNTEMKDYIIRYYDRKLCKNSR